MCININKSMAQRIVVYVLTFCVFLFVVLQTVFYFSSKRQIEEITLKSAELETGKTMLEAEKILLSVTKVARNYKWVLEDERRGPQQIIELTRRIVEDNPEILGSAIAFEPSYFKDQGRYFAPYSYSENKEIKTMQLGKADYEYFYMDWYQIPVATGKSCWSEPYYDTIRGNALITTYSVPFYKTIDKKKQIAGVITFDLPLDWFTNIVSSLKILETGYASVLTKNGTFITHPDKELIMNQSIFSYAAEMNSPELREIGRKMQREESGFVSSTLKGVERKIYFTSLPSSKWTMVVVFPVSEMYGPLRSILMVLILLVVIGLTLLSVIVTRIIAKQITPLRHFARSAREIAKGNFSNVLPAIKTKDELKDLHDSFEYMQTKLAKYIEDLKLTTSAKEKIESELRIAREIQMGMIPKIFPPFPNLTEIDIYATLQPAKEVGGDLYDFFMIDENHICFAIGDVSGKGVPASLFMAVTRTLLRSVAPELKSPRAIMESLNKSLSTNNESNMFVTFFLGVIELSSGKLTYANAGHNPPVLISREGKVVYFELTQDIPIGIFEEFSYVEKVRTLVQGDKLFFYTDGVTEAENQQEELYSDKKLIDCLAAHWMSAPHEIITEVTEDIAMHVKGNQQSDDITMLTIFYYGNKE